MADIRIIQLPVATGPTAPVGADSIAIDGLTTRQTTLGALGGIIAPLASQAEAEAGTNAVKRMSPLTTSQAITSIGGGLFASFAQGLLASTALQPAALANTPLTGQTTIEKTKNGNIQNLWSDGVNYQIVSDIKGVSFEKDFLNYGTWPSPSTSEEPAVREQYVTAHSVYDFSAGIYKGMTRPIYVMGRAQQHVIKQAAFDKIAGDFVEMHDKGPNRGEHFARVTHLYQHANRADASINNAATGGFFSIGGVADSWCEFTLLADNGYNANGFGSEIDIRNENRVRGETSPLNSMTTLFPATGFQVNQTYSTDFSQYHITRAIAIVPSNAYGVTVGQNNLYVGFHTGAYISGYSNYGIVFGPSIAYNDPQNPATTVTSPQALTFANDDIGIMGFQFGGVQRLTVVRQSANQLALVRNSDGKHHWLADYSTGQTFLGNGNFSVDLSGNFAGTNITYSGYERASGVIYISPSSGATAAMNGTYSDLVIDPAGTLATLTVTLPTAPVNGQKVRFSTTQIVTAFTLNAGANSVSNAPTTLSAGQALAYIFVLSKNAWYRSA